MGNENNKIVILKKKIDVYKLHILISNFVVYVFIVYHVESDRLRLLNEESMFHINIYSIKVVSKEEEKK